MLLWRIENIKSAAKDRISKYYYKGSEYLSDTRKDWKIDMLMPKDQVIMCCRSWRHWRIIVPVTNCENFLWRIDVLPLCSVKYIVSLLSYSLWWFCQYNNLLVKRECWNIVTSKDILNVFYWCNPKDMLLILCLDVTIVIGHHRVMR